MNNKLNWQNIVNKELVIIQTKSTIGALKNQIASIKGLGLRGRGSVSKLKATPEVIGMVKKVDHLIKVEVL
ncbi:50S ribosomal protein L30 [Pseudomonadota bacterium]